MLLTLGAGLLALGPGCGGEDTSDATSTTTTWPSNTDSNTDTWTATPTDTTTTPLNPLCGAEPTPDHNNSSCAVYARADADPALADGTPEHPYASLQSAADIAAKSNRRVLACKVAPFKERLHLTAPVEIWGGIDCEKDWSHSWTDRTALDGFPEKAAVTIDKSAGGSLIANFTITVPDSVTPGVSAVGVIVDLVLKRTSIWTSEIIVGNGASGADGAPAGLPAPNGADAAGPARPGGASAACVTSANLKGGVAGMTTCDEGPTLGGNGGMGGMPPSASGQSGADGYPAGMINAGMGQTSAAMCTAGGNGSPGDQGQVGIGGNSYGHLSIDGISSVPGFPGDNGTRGQGGGGGGGARAGAYCLSGMNIVAGIGASGGGGGGGGCSGKGGNPGQGGGSAVGIVSLSEHLSLQSVSMTIGNGGNGGKGALGQAGGLGGNGAPGGASSGMSPSASGCAGGNGGGGGRGGPGGGGRGGHVLGVAYTQMFDYKALTIDVGKPGEGGLPGEGLQGAGAKGQIAPYLSIVE